jgi:hypothetical protein
MDKYCSVCGVVITPENYRSKNSKCISCWNEYTKDLKEQHKLNNIGRVKDHTKSQACRECKTQHPQTWFDTDASTLNWFDRSCGMHTRIRGYKKCSAKSGKGYFLEPDYACELMQLPCYMCNGYSYEDVPVTGIDRLDSSKGYTKLNCRPACTPCNLSKNDSSIHDFYKRSKQFTVNYEKQFPGSILLNLYYDDEFDFFSVVSSRLDQTESCTIP